MITSVSAGACWVRVVSVVLGVVLGPGLFEVTMGTVTSVLSVAPAAPPVEGQAQIERLQV